MSRLRHLEVLARLRRLELDTSRRSLGELTRRSEACTAEAARLWDSLTDTLPMVEEVECLRIQALAIDGTRRRSIRLGQEVERLEVERIRVGRQVGDQLLTCKQLEIALETQRLAQRKNDLRHEQVTIDEHALATKRTDLYRQDGMSPRPDGWQGTDR